MEIKSSVFDFNVGKFGADDIQLSSRGQVQ
jgi:hypothetical protein